MAPSTRKARTHDIPHFARAGWPLPRIAAHYGYRSTKAVALLTAGIDPDPVVLHFSDRADAAEACDAAGDHEAAHGRDDAALMDFLRLVDETPGLPTRVAATAFILRHHFQRQGA